MKPYDVLYRIQASHDSARQEYGRAVAITCPQLPAQRTLLTEVLTHTNRAWCGTKFRTMADPETRVADFHHLDRGNNTGVDYSSVVREDPELLQKQSLRFAFDPVRDIPAPEPNKDGRADGDDVDLGAMYGSVTIGQTKDVVRALPLKRQVPTPAPSGMPLLRVEKK